MRNFNAKHGGEGKKVGDIDPFHQGPGIQIAKIKTHKKKQIDEADLNEKSQGGKNQFHIVANWVPRAGHNIWSFDRLNKQLLINVENSEWQVSI